MADRSDLEEVAPGLARLRVLFVNVYFVGSPDAREPWVLVDAGLPFSTETIQRAAEARFGGRSPAAIVLTHGHFDHVGALRTLAEYWDVPVYAHPLEMPYLTGRSAYPPPDPSVSGAMARLSFLYPRGPIDLGGRAQVLPEDGSVPGLPDWRWIFTPGHSPGHVAFLREADRTLLAGDAFVTVQQESALAVLMQKQHVHGPPAYFTPDWESARQSVEQLAALAPEVAGTGHGVPMRGTRLREQLDRLARDFGRLAVPSRGRYVGHAAQTDERGVITMPPSGSIAARTALVGVLAGVGLALLWTRARS